MKHDDTQHLIGKILDETAQRDAIHIAVLPVIAGERWLEPGERIKLVAGTTDRVQSVRRSRDAGHGVVDPFLMESPGEGERFFMFLTPGTITGMRHHFTLPAVDHPASMGEAETWLRRFADSYGMDYDEMIETARDGDHYILANGRDLHGKEELKPGEHEEFWRSVESLLGRRFSEEHRETVIWTCSC